MKVRGQFQIIHKASFTLFSDTGSFSDQAFDDYASLASDYQAPGIHCLYTGITNKYHHTCPFHIGSEDRYEGLRLVRCGS